MFFKDLSRYQNNSKGNSIYRYSVLQAKLYFSACDRNVIDNTDAESSCKSLGYSKFQISSPALNPNKITKWDYL